MKPVTCCIELAKVNILSPVSYFVIILSLILRKCKVCMLGTVIGASPTLIVTAARICIYVSNILPILPHVFHTLVLEIHVHPEMLRIFWYIDVLTCMIYN